MKERNEPERLCRVLVVHNYYQTAGGEDTVFRNECRLLREHGHEVETYERDNEEIRNSVIRKVLLPFTAVFSLKTYCEVRRIIRSEGIDVVHCHNTFPLVSPSVYYAARSCGVPVVQTVHNFRFLCPNSVFFRDGKPCEDCLEKGLGCSLRHGCYRGSRLQTFVLAQMLAIHRALGTYRRIRYIFLTEFNRSKFRKLLGEETERQFIKPNFEYADPRGAEAPAERDGSFVFAGRLDRVKGVDFLAETWGSEGELYLFGNGELEAEVRQACARNRHIHFMGFRPKEEIGEYLRKARALLFTSDLYEGFPMTIAEAFAAGTPVVCPDSGNAADIVRGAGAGATYRRRDAGSFRKALDEVREGFDGYSAKALEAYNAALTPEANYRQQAEIYQTLIRERRQKAR